MELLDRMVLATLPLVPHRLMRRLAGRYIAGETLEEAVQSLRALAARGFPGILDVLGEGVRSEAEARGALAQYLAGAEQSAAHGLDAYVSVKPTHLGLPISEALCLELYDELATRCGELGLFLRVEMEDHPTTDATLRVFDALRARHEHVGIVLQSRLLRTPRDAEQLLAADRGRLDVRVVKGIYLEPREIAHTAPEPIRDAFVALVETLARGGARLRLATHDPLLADRCIEVIEQTQAPSDWELEVLLGVQETLWARWRERGFTVRVYVPYGPEWRAYSLRRLSKNPEILRHVMRDTLRLS